MATDSQEIQAIYDRLLTSTHHVENRAWTGFYNFLTANSLLVLAWAAIVASAEVPGKWIVLTTISVIGVVMGLQWSLLGTRTWEYALGYAD